MAGDVPPCLTVLASVSNPVENGLDSLRSLVSPRGFSVFVRVVTELEVEMGMTVGRGSGLANLSDRSSQLDFVSNLDGSGLEMKIGSEPAATVIDLDDIAGVFVVEGLVDSSGRGSDKSGTLGSLLVRLFYHVQCGSVRPGIQPPLLFAIERQLEPSPGSRRRCSFR